MGLWGGGGGEGGVRCCTMHGDLCVCEDLQ